MTTEIFVVNENDLVELVEKIMDWKRIHHIPVVNKKNKITGIITRSNLDLHTADQVKNNLIIAKEIMVKKIITVTPETYISEAKKIMIANRIGCLPIIDNDELIGIFTKSDLDKLNKNAEAYE
jgi:CBS domain-containing protein